MEYVFPHDVLQVNIDERLEADQYKTNTCYQTLVPRYNHFDHTNSSTSTNSSKSNTSIISQKSTSHELIATLESDEAKAFGRRARQTLLQRLKRQNESPETKMIRRQKNAELNRRRRANKADIRVAMEKNKNRLRQRIKREMDRMLRTKEKRQGFLDETFQQMEAVFTEGECNIQRQKIIDVVTLIEHGRK